MDQKIASSPKEASPSSSAVYDSAIEKAIEKKIEGIRIFLNPQYGKTTPEEEEAVVIKINPATKKYCELKIKILQDSPWDPVKLKEILKAKQKEYEKTEESEDIEKLITELEMLRYVLFLINIRNRTYGDYNETAPH